MEYPKINLTLEKLKALEGKSVEDLPIDGFGFHIDSYHPGRGGSGHYYGESRALQFENLDELSTILLNQSDLPAEAFFYADALSTCDEIQQELLREGITCQWKDQMIVSERTGKHPVRARVCYYRQPQQEHLTSLAVLRDGTTIAHFQPLAGHGDY